MRRPRLIWLGMLALTPSWLQAQDCEAVRFGTFNITNQGLPTQVAFFQDAEISCPGGKRLLADQAIQIEAAGRIELIGNVRYRDAERMLTAQRAEYYKLEQRIHATGNVVIRDLKTGSTIHGQEINYYQTSPSRPEALLEAVPSTVRPHAVLRDDPGRVTDRDSTTVVADMIQVLGQQRFRGLGSAVISRDSMTAHAGIAEYDQATGDMLLAGQGRIEGRRYRLLGDTIRARVEQDTLREVTAYRNARLTTEEITIEAPRIRIELSLGELQRMAAARSRDSAVVGAATVLAPQPRIMAEDFQLSADSIDIRAPGQELEEVIAIGNAFSSTNDTIPAPPGVGELQAALSTDWMRGDTVQAFFSANPRAEADSAAHNRVLDRVISSGSPASSLYRRREPPVSPPTDTAQAPPGPAYSIGYMLARRIEITMAEGEVQDVKASDDVRGVYLQPRTGTATQAARRNGQKP